MTEPTVTVDEAWSNDVFRVHTADGVYAVKLFPPNMSRERPNAAGCDPLRAVGIDDGVRDAIDATFGQRALDARYAGIGAVVVTSGWRRSQALITSVSTKTSTRRSLPRRTRRCSMPSLR